MARHWAPRLGPGQARFRGCVRAGHPPQALASHSAGDATCTRIEDRLRQLGAARDAIAGRMHSMLLAAAFGGRPANPGAALRLIGQGETLLNAAQSMP